jgi:hypothetical protein
MPRSLTIGLVLVFREFAAAALGCALKERLALFIFVRQEERIVSWRYARDSAFDSQNRPSPVHEKNTKLNRAVRLAIDVPL